MRFQTDITVAVRPFAAVSSSGLLDSNLTTESVTNIAVFGTLPVPQLLQESLEQVKAGFGSGLAPTLTEEGTSGSYMLRGAGEQMGRRPVALWKPVDEEPFAPNNPRGMKAPFGSETCRPGVKSGESSLREVLAYLLDHEGFAGVPPTALVEISHPSLTTSLLTEKQVTSAEVRNLISGLVQFEKTSKRLSPFSSPKSALSTACTSETSSSASSAKTGTECGRSMGKLGSYQMFVANEGPVENYSESLFPTDEVHKIAVLDLRLLNLDRNACNILVKQSDSGLKLVPIDHGLIMPDSLAIQSFDLAWLSYPQAEEPFSAETLAYISRLDVDADIKLVERNFKVRPECLRNIKISSILLKEAAAMGLTLAQIGQILCRPDDDEEAPSLLE